MDNLSWSKPYAPATILVSIVALPLIVALSPSICPGQTLDAYGGTTLCCVLPGKGALLHLEDRESLVAGQPGGQWLVYERVYDVSLSKITANIATKYATRPTSNSTLKLSCPRTLYRTRIRAGVRAKQLEDMVPEAAQLLARSRRTRRDRSRFVRRGAKHLR